MWVGALWCASPAACIPFDPAPSGAIDGDVLADLAGEDATSEAAESDEGAAPDAPDADVVDADQPGCDFAMGPGGVCIRPLSLAAGGAHTCAIFDDGSLWCWGARDFGQLGDGFGAPSGPVRVDLPREVVQVSAARGHTCARDDHDDLYCWGDNLVYQMGPRAEGDAVFEPLLAVEDVQDISVKPPATCVIRDGRVGCFGALFDGQSWAPGSPYAKSKDIVWEPTIEDAWDVEILPHTACVLHGEAQLSCWGEGTGIGHGSTADSAEPVTLTLDFAPARIAPGGGHVCVYDASGEHVACWGSNLDRQIVPFGGLDRYTSPKAIGEVIDSPVASLAAGWRHTCSVSAQGAVACWGYSINGATGRVASLGGPVGVGVPAADQVVCGDQHSCALDRDGVIWCWGRNTYGEVRADQTSQDTILMPTRVKVR